VGNRDQHKQITIFTQPIAPIKNLIVPKTLPFSASFSAPRLYPLTNSPPPAAPTMNKSFGIITFFFALITLMTATFATQTSLIFNRPAAIPQIFDVSPKIRPFEETNGVYIPQRPNYGMFDEEDQESFGGPIEANIPSFTNPRDALSFYFGDNSPSTEEENLQFVEQLRDAAAVDKDLQQHRESKISMLFGMDVDAYTDLAEDYRKRALTFATSFDIDYSLFENTYGELIDECRERLINNYDLISIDKFNTLADELNSLDQGRSLFAYSYSLLPVDAEDLVLQGIVNLDGMINWASSFLLSHKCQWCTKLAGYIKSKACGKAGDIICKYIGGFCAEILAPLFIKFGCGAPLNLSSHIGNLCQKGVNWIQGKGRVTDKKICQSISFGSIRLPRHNGIIFTCSAKTITIGSLC
jgi:hypothetical protein